MARTRLTEFTKDLSTSKDKQTEARKKTNLHDARGRDALVNAFSGTSTQSIKEVDPKDCVVYELNDREFKLLTESDVADLVEGFIDPTIGQLQPAIARKAPAGSKHKYEIIAGSRRLKASLCVLQNTSIKFKLKIILHNFTEIEALKAMREENGYEKPSAYERAFATQRQIQKVFNGNLTKYCEVMKEKTSTVNDLLAFTQVPEDVLDAYKSRKEIPLKHPVKLRSELKKHEQVGKYKVAMIKAAKSLSSQKDKPAPPEVLKHLLKAANDATLKVKPKESKSVALKVAGTKKGIEVIVSKTGITTIRLSKVCNSHPDDAKEALMKYLDDHFEGNVSA